MFDVNLMKNVYALGQHAERRVLVVEGNNKWTGR